MQEPWGGEGAAVFAAQVCLQINFRRPHIAAVIQTEAMVVYFNQTERRPDDFRRLAVHEAGHAIAAVKLDIMFDHVMIGPTVDDGEVAITHDPFDDLDSFSDDAIKALLVFYAAGAAAEMLVFGEVRRHAITSDKSNCCQLQPTPPILDFDSCIGLALPWLTEETVDRVARSLLCNNTLDYQSVCDLVGVLPPWGR